MQTSFNDDPNKIQEDKFVIKTITGHIQNRTLNSLVEKALVY